MGMTANGKLLRTREKTVTQRRIGGFPEAAPVAAEVDMRTSLLKGEASAHGDRIWS